jgi:thiosulfate/3-mercaptopyruvate sulfurtransferase
MYVLKRGSFFLSLCLLFLLHGCGKEKLAPQEDHLDLIELPSLLLEPQWLKNNLNAKGLLILDARSKSEYTLGHIPGAISFPVTELNSTIAGQEKNLKGIIEINKLFGLKGIRMDRPIIVYGNEHMRTVSRLFWALELHGHQKTSVLNGGFQGWKAQAYPTAINSVVPEETEFVSRYTKANIDKLEVLRATNQEDVLIIDSRSEAEYLGLKSKGDRKGHIPSAKLFSASAAFASSEQGCFMHDIHELKKIYGSIDPSLKVYLYCNSGRSATVNYLAMRILGLDASVYDGSWLEWASDQGLPISTDFK